MNDDQIIKLFFTRDEDAIQQTAYKYGHRLMGLAANIVQNNEDAEESVNDTYLKAGIQFLPQNRNTSLHTWQKSAATSRLASWTGKTPPSGKRR